MRQSMRRDARVNRGGGSSKRCNHFKLTALTDSAKVKELGDDRCPFHEIDTIFGQPVETFQKEKDGEESHKARVEFIAENGEG